MMRTCLLILLILLLCFSASSLACGEIKPDPQVTKIVKRLAYDDFPTASDVFSIIRIESSYDPKAKNINERERSIGYMQVQYGPEDPRKNIAEGIARLRENYMRFGTREAAVKSYNIGPGNYANKIYLISAQEYYDKFALQKLVYATYATTGTIHKLGKKLGCGKANVLPTSLTAKRRLAEQPKAKIEERCVKCLKAARKKAKPKVE